jgi:rhombotail lipoprotein
MKSIKLAIVSAVTAASLSACAWMNHSSTNKNSLAEFLYPEQARPVEAVATPELRLPLRVGIAFVPAAYDGEFAPNERHKALLAQAVADKFKRLPIVDSIDVIPTAYLRQGGSFVNLEQLQQLFSVDVVVLLSYDQSVVTNPTLASIAYWTIVGAYLIPGEKNDTQTLLDAAVYDLASHKLLFRAPGSSVVKSHDTLVGNHAKLQANSEQGYAEAAQDLQTNLQVALDDFTQRVKARPEQYRVVTRPGYSGSGSNDQWFVGIACLLLVGVLVNGRQQQGKE